MGRRAKISGKKIRLRNTGYVRMCIQELEWKMEYQIAKKKHIRNCCSVMTCDNLQNLRLHRLPRDPLIKELWARACGLPNRPINSKTRVCSLHFRPRDFINQSIRRLQPDAYPRIHLPEEGYIQELECKIEYQMANLQINKKQAETKNSFYPKRAHKEKEVPPPLEEAAAPKKKQIRNSCSVMTCDNPQNLILYRIPRDPSLKELWARACGLPNRPINSKTRVCSLHFRPEDFRNKSIRWLVRNAYPRIHLPEEGYIQELECKIEYQMANLQINKEQAETKNSFYPKRAHKEKEVPPQLEETAAPKKKHIRNSCSVMTCDNPQNLRLYRIPRDPSLKELWARACGLPNRPINSKTRVCGFHFRPEDFLEGPQSERNGGQFIRRLQPDAYPRIHLPEEGDVRESVLNIESTKASLAMETDISYIHNYAGNSSTNVYPPAIEETKKLNGMSHTETLKVNQDTNYCSFSEKVDAKPGFPYSERQKISLENTDIKPPTSTSYSKRAPKEEEVPPQLEETIITTPGTDSSRLHVGVVPYDRIRVTRTLLLKSTSTEAYNLLCNQGLIHPPPLSHQTKWMQNFSCKEGIQSDALDILGESVLAYNAPVDRLVVLCFRDIPSNKGVESPIGLTLGFARGLVQPWKQAVYFSQGFRTIKALMDEMRALIYEMENRGLRVIALVFPPTERWTVALGLSSNSSFLPNPSNPKRTLFAFPDASTILQFIRKEILRNNLSFHGMRLSLKDLKEKTFFLLGSEHFDEKKNGLSLAAEFISPCIVEAAISSSNKEMGVLIQTLSDWFEVMNPSEEKPTLFGGDGLSVQTNTLSKLFNILPKISLSQESNVVMSLRISIQAVEALIISLRENYGVRSFSTERLSSEFIVGMVDPWHVQGELSPVVQEKFLRLQTLGPERGEIITEKDFIPSVKVFGALDVKIRLKPVDEEGIEDIQEEHSIIIK